MGRWQEKRLLSRVRAKKAGAFEELEKLARPIAELALRRAERAWPALRGEHEDQMQAFFTLLLEEDAKILGSFRGEAKLETWLFVVAYRQFLRRAKALDARRLSLDESEHGRSETEPADPLAREHLRRALGELPPEDRAFLGLLFDQEVPVAEIAIHLGVTPDAVRMRKKRLLDRLRKSLNLEDL